MVMNMGGTHGEIEKIYNVRESDEARFLKIRKTRDRERERKTKK